MNAVLVGILAYVALQLGIGLAVSPRVRNEDDYFVAGRTLGPGVAGLSIFATWFGAETCIGAAGAIHDDGIGRDTVEPFAYGLCLVLMGVFFAAPFWRAKVVTLADLFRERYSHGVERLAALLLIPTSVLWAAAQIRAFGHVLVSAGNLDLELAIGAAALAVIAYTFVGGMLADVITDGVQSVAIVLGLIVVLVVAVGSLGGVGAALAAIEPERISIFAADGPGGLATLEAWALPICGSVVAQEALSRGFACRSAIIARRATLLGAGLYLAVGSIPVFLGLVGPQLLPALESGESLLPELSEQLLPTLGHVLFAGAIVSAILSTVDSTLLVASSLLSRNLLPTRRAGTQAAQLRVARLTVAALGVVAWLLAHQSEGVLDLVEQASGFGSAAILVLVVFGLFTRTGGPASAYAALVTGSGVWIGGRYLLADVPYPYLASLAAALAAFLLCAPAAKKAAAGSDAPAA